VERTAALQNLSQRLLKVQDQERRRIARDLHDSTGQTLTALKISVSLLQQRVNNDKAIFDELTGISDLADRALQEIRTTSYLLHPPGLDEAGFSCAARWYLEGFAQRSGMKVRADFAPDIGRLDSAIEIGLFRVLQESLTNAHRHAETSEVYVSFRCEADVAILEVRDYGHGMPQELISSMGSVIRGSGVGLAGMSERLNELRGELEIRAANPGTMLRASVPLHGRAASACA
jgi:signal transduction histidine kinase